MDVTICRLCLAQNVRSYNIANTPYREIFEKITDIKLESSDGRPIAACYMCHSHLKKCLEMRERVQRANAVLMKFLNSENTQERTSQLRKEAKILNNFTVSILSNINILALPESAEVKTEENEVKVEEDKAEFLISLENNVPDCESNRQTDSDYDDPEYDVPLNRIVKSPKLKKETKTNRKRKKSNGNSQRSNGTVFKGDYAQEILLTIEEQIQELKERSQTENYKNSPFKCNLCYKGFIDGQAFENHRQKHDELQGAYECGVCRLRYLTARQLCAHRVTSHERRYLCALCGHRAHTAHQAREHERWHRGYTFKCKLCGMEFKKSTSYLTHLRTRHPTEHVCNICGDSFLGAHGLAMHRNKMHRHTLEQMSELTEDPSLRCADCDVQFLNADAWKRHVLTSAKHAQENEKSATCVLCEAAVPAGGWAAHARLHHKLRNKHKPSSGVKLSCPHCDLKFGTKSNQVAHVKRIHLGLKCNKNFVCEICAKKCTSLAALRYHQRTHSGQRPHACASCGKRFSYSAQLTVHARVHSGERPYACADCGKRFAQKPALNRHRRIHTGAKPYKCQYCTKQFNQSTSLKIHVNAVHLKMPKKRKTENNTADVCLEKKHDI